MSGGGEQVIARLALALSDALSPLGFLPVSAQSWLRDGGEIPQRVEICASRHRGAGGLCWVELSFGRPGGGAAFQPVLTLRQGDLLAGAPVYIGADPQDHSDAALRAVAQALAARLAPADRAEGFFTLLDQIATPADDYMLTRAEMLARLGRVAEFQAVRAGAGPDLAQPLAAMAAQFGISDEAGDVS